MHSVLEEILNTAELHAIFEEILNDFIDVYMNVFHSVLDSPDKNRLSVQRIEDEVAYLASELSELPSFLSLPCALPFI